MKTNDRLLLTAVIFAGLLARPVFGDTKPDTNLPPLLPPPPVLADPAAVTTSTPAAPPAVTAPVELSAPAPDSTAAAKPAKAAKKKTKATKAAKAAKTKPARKATPKFPEVSVPLKPGSATVSAKRVNVRAQASTKSEIIAHLTNGEPVNVIEEITRENRKPDEPTVWAKINLPAGTHSWVMGQFIDASNKTVTAKKLNVRGGPGENYSVLATLQKGDPITQINEKGGWLEIAAPSNAIAFIAAAYLKQEIAPTPAEPAPTPTPVVEGQPLAAAPTEMPVAPPTPAPEPAQAASPAMPPPNLPMILDPSIKRIVDREGIVRRTWSIQAPDDFRLVSAETGETVDYLHTTSTNLDLSRYKGLHIIVTGEEGLDRRWKDTPVLTIRRIQVVE